MNHQLRVASVRKAIALDQSITGFPNFDLDQLNLPVDQGDIEFPVNVRLGHLIERIVISLIKLSPDYRVLHENIQIIKEKKTLGELDVIIEDIKTKEVIHLEIAYKFYLFDPEMSTIHIDNWIGPNRKDTLTAKFAKLRSKQFPLLYHSYTKSALDQLNIEKMSQSLCFFVSLYIPYRYKGSIDPAYQKAVKGYYVNLDQFKKLDEKEKVYYIPSKKEWGIDPSGAREWQRFDQTKDDVIQRLIEQQSVLCWEDRDGVFSSYFIVWW